MSNSQKQQNIMTRKQFLKAVEKQFPNGLIKCITSYEEIGKEVWESHFAVVCTFSEEHKINGYNMIYNYHTMGNETSASFCGYETYEQAMDKVFYMIH